jgi:ADP-ribosylglycohydrolase
MGESRILNILAGTHIGDAVGEQYEMKSSLEITSSLQQQGVSLTTIDKRLKDLANTNTTDDTAQTLVIADSLVRLGHIEISDIAHGFYRTLQESPTGMGRITRTVLQEPGYLEDPIGVSRHVHMREFAQGTRTLGNGPVMRTSLLSQVPSQSNLIDVLHQAGIVGSITHGNPGSIQSAQYLSGVEWLITQGSTLEEALSIMHEQNWTSNHVNSSIAMLDSDSLETYFEEKKKWFLAFTPILASIHTLRQGYNFAQTLYTIIRLGGDTDTNAAVGASLYGILHPEEDLSVYLPEVSDQLYYKELATKLAEHK